MSPLGVIGGIFAVCGGGLAALGIGLGLRDRRAETRGSRVPATIVDLVEVRGVRHHGRLLAAVFEFTAADGSRVRKQSGVATTMPAHAVGDTVVVWHDPAHPDQADIVGEARWMAPSLVIIGLLFAAAGIAMVVLR